MKLSKPDSTYIQLGGSYDDHLPETLVPEEDGRVQSVPQPSDAPIPQDEFDPLLPTGKKGIVTLTGAQLLMVAMTIIFVLAAAIAANGWWLVAALLYGSVTVWFAVFRKQHAPTRKEPLTESSPPVF